MNVSDLKPASYNPRNISDRKLKTLGTCMSEFGDLSGIVFNRRTQRLVSGHKRLETIPGDALVYKQSFTDDTGTVAVGFIELGDGDRLLYREVDWPEDREKAANITANREFGEYDEQKLRSVLDSIQVKSIRDIGTIQVDTPAPTAVFPTIIDDDTEDANHLEEADYESSVQFREEDAPGTINRAETICSFIVADKLSFKVPGDVFVAWEQDIKRQAGFSNQAICNEIIKRLELGEYVGKQ